MAEGKSNTTVTGAPGPDAMAQQQRRIVGWHAQAHTLLDEYSIPRMDTGLNAGESRWLSLAERVQLLHEKTERWRQRAFRAEKRFEDEFTQPDSAEPETETPEGTNMTTSPEEQVERASELFGSATTRDGVRHAATERVAGYGYAHCDHVLNVAWLEPLQPGQEVCKRPACQRAAKKVEAPDAS